MQRDLMTEEATLANLLFAILQMLCDLIIEGAAIVNFLLLGHFRDDFGVPGVRLGSFWASLGLFGGPFGVAGALGAR